MGLIHCQECARPWGYIYDRGVTPTEVDVTRSRLELIDTLVEEIWRADYEPDELASLDAMQLPAVKIVEVVYITEALAAFACEHGISEEFPEPPCWTELAWLDVPAWLLKGRKRRWAVRWDCCDIGSPSLYLKEKSRAGC